VCHGVSWVWFGTERNGMDWYSMVFGILLIGRDITECTSRT
jgi:hypothetical protein